MTEKSEFRKRLDDLTPEQLKAVERDVADKKAALGGSNEFSRRLANMSQSEFDRYRAENCG